MAKPVRITKNPSSSPEHGVRAKPITNVPMSSPRSFTVDTTCPAHGYALSAGQQCPICRRLNADAPQYLERY